MYTLYYSPGACSLSPHIALREAGLEFSLVKVNRDKTTDAGDDFRAVNPLGYVPVLKGPDGLTLTEGPAIVQYIADRVPQKHLAPAWNNPARYQMQSWLNFVSTELHKSFSPLFNPAAGDETKKLFRDRIVERLAWVDTQLAGKTFLLGDVFSVADIYLFVVSNWTAPTKIDISGLSNLQAFRQRMGARPAVQAAMVAEGLVKA